MEGTWRLIMFRHWAFLAFTAFLMFCLDLDVIEDIAGKRPLARTLSHGGLFLILFGGFFGAPDFSDVQMGNSYSIIKLVWDPWIPLVYAGMICGAVWAKAAWGNYWTWDGVNFLPSAQFSLHSYTQG